MTFYRKESFHSQESNTINLSEHIFRLLGSIIRLVLIKIYFKLVNWNTRQIFWQNS